MSSRSRPAGDHPLGVVDAGPLAVDDQGPRLAARRAKQPRVSVDQDQTGEEVAGSRAHRCSVLAVHQSRARFGCSLGPGDDEGMRCLRGPDALDQAEVTIEVRGLGPFAGPHRVAAVRQLGAEVVVVNDPAQRRRAARRRSGSRGRRRSARPSRRGAAPLVDHHRRPDGERFEHDVAKRLGEQRRHDHRPRPVEQPGQRGPPSNPSKRTFGRSRARAGASPRKARSLRSAGRPRAGTASAGSGAGIPSSTSRPAAAR